MQGSTPAHWATYRAVSVVEQEHWLCWALQEVCVCVCVCVCCSHSMRRCVSCCAGSPSECTFCELKPVHCIGSRSGSGRVSEEQWTTRMWVCQITEILLSTSDAVWQVVPQGACSMANNWKTTTQALAELSAHLLSILHCCVCRTFIQENVYCMQGHLWRQIWTGYCLPNCDQMVHHVHSDAHKLHTYTHTQALVGRQTHNVFVSISFNCTWQETSILCGEFVELFQEVIHHKTRVRSVTFTSGTL